jgi:hypothetical protein
LKTVFRTDLPGGAGGGRVRKPLHANGFPHAFERGLWSAKAMVDWLVSAGRAESHVFSTCDWSVHSLRRSRQSCSTNIGQLETKELG